MSRTKGTFSLTSNIEPKFGAPLDARTIVKLLADLTASNTFEYPYKGMKVFVEENNKSYTLVGSDPTVSTNWIEDNSGGHTIKNPAGTAMTQRSNLQFVDLTVSDDSTNDATKVESVHVIQSESELENLPDGLYMLDEDEETVIDGNLVGYDNTTSGLNAENVQDAIDEVVGTLDDKIDISAKGVANGVAELDATGKVPSSQLPSFVDDVIEVADYDHLPATGETGKIYVALDTNKTYRWGGSEYVEISESLALGETSSTAYRGDRGKTAYDHSQLTSGNPHNVTKSEVGLGNVDNTSDSTKKTNFTGSIASGNTGFVTGGDAYTALNNKADKVSSATNGNLAGLNGSGNPTDSGWNGAKDTTSISGNPISISGLKSNQLAINPIITLEPIQDLHGQSKPYPAGGGKNLLPLTVDGIKAENTDGTWSGNVYTVNGGIFTIVTDSANNVIAIDINTQSGGITEGSMFYLDRSTVLPTGTYYLNGCADGGSASGSYRLRATINGTQYNNYNSQDDISVSSGGNVDCGIQVYRGWTSTTKVRFYPMIRLQSESDRTFAPPSNISPISGYDKIEALSCGKNLFDKTRVELGQINQTTGEDENSSTVYRYKGYIYLKPNTKYTIGKNNGQTLRVFFYSQNDYLNSSTYTGTVTTFNTGNTIRRIRFQSADFNTIKEILQVEEGTSASTIYPYVKATSISESLGQTVYGGASDVRTGKLTVTHKMVDMGDYTWVYRGSSDGVNYFNAPFADMLTTAGEHSFICECYDSIAQRGINYTISRYNIYDTSAVIYVNDTRYSADAAGAAALKTALAGIKMVYELATPFTIQLTPHEISLLKDYAYISTNGTSITLDYHNGELASLADVSQLGETVNLLGKYSNLKDISSEFTINTTSGSGNAQLLYDSKANIVFINAYFNATTSVAYTYIIGTISEKYRPSSTVQIHGGIYINASDAIKFGNFNMYANGSLLNANSSWKNVSVYGWYTVQ